MLLCPRLLSLLFNSLRHISLRTRFPLHVYCMCWMLYWVRRALCICSLEKSEMIIVKKEQRGILNQCFAKKCFHREARAVLSFLIQASASQYWITWKLLWCFCMQHMIYYCTFCCTIKGSQDSVLLQKLSSANSNCFCFFLSINQLFTMMKLINLQAIFYLQLLAMWNWIILMHSPIHVIYTQEKTHTTRFRRLFIYTVYINLYCVSRCLQYFTQA